MRISSPKPRGSSKPVPEPCRIGSGATRAAWIRVASTSPRPPPHRPGALGSPGDPRRRNDRGGGRGRSFPRRSGGWSEDLGEPIRVVVARTPRGKRAARERGRASGLRCWRRWSRSLPPRRRSRRLASSSPWSGWSAAGGSWRRRSRPGSGRDKRAQLEVLAATAEIALGQEEAARASLERALRAQPELRLDPARLLPQADSPLRGGARRGRTTAVRRRRRSSLCRVSRLRGPPAAGCGARRGGSRRPPVLRLGPLGAASSAPAPGRHVLDAGGEQRGGDPPASGAARGREVPALPSPRTPTSRCTFSAPRPAPPARAPCRWSRHRTPRRAKGWRPSPGPCLPARRARWRAPSRRSRVGFAARNAGRRAADCCQRSR